MISEEFTALEALGIAIRREIDAQEFYKVLADFCKDELLKDKFMSLYHEEIKNQKLLEKMYKNMFPDVKLVLPESKLPKEVIEGETRRKKPGIKDILHLAINEERESREFYLTCAEKANDLSGKRMFRVLAGMKFSHLAILNTELELLEKYPAYIEGQQPWEVESRLRTDKIKRRVK
jgi:rubrerythrin